MRKAIQSFFTIAIPKPFSRVAFSLLPVLAYVVCVGSRIRLQQSKVNLKHHLGPQ